MIDIIKTHQEQIPIERAKAPFDGDVWVIDSIIDQRDNQQVVIKRVKDGLKRPQWQSQIRKYWQVKPHAKIGGATIYAANKKQEKKVKMQGLVKRRDDSTVYLDIKYSGLVSVSKTPKDGYKPISVPNPKTGEDVTKYVAEYDAVEGLVTEIEWRDTKDQYDDRYMDFRVHLDAAGTPVVVTFPFKSRSGSRLMNVAENIDYNRPLKIVAWRAADESLAVAFQQRDQDDKFQNVPPRYRKGAMRDCPEPTYSELNGWDFTAVNEYLWKVMMNKVIPAVEAVGNQRPDVESGEPSAQQEVHQDPWAVEQPTEAPAPAPAESTPSSRGQAAGASYDDPYTDAPPVEDQAPDDDIPW